MIELIFHKYLIPAVWEIIDSFQWLLEFSLSTFTYIEIFFIYVHTEITKLKMQIYIFYSVWHKYGIN